MLNSATGTPLADTCGANIAAGYTTEEVPTCRQRAKNNESSRQDQSNPQGEDPSQNTGCAKPLKHEEPYRNEAKSVSVFSVTAPVAELGVASLM